MTAHTPQASTEAGRIVQPAEVRVWDRFVRVFHWSLLVLFAVAYYTRDKWETIHIGAGYAILNLVVLRIIWGFAGSEHARFRAFLYSPAAIARFLVATARFRARRYLGHNPAGGAMVVALIVAMLAICGSGIAMTLDRFWGIEWIEEVHEAAVYATLGLLVLHVAGVVLASVEHRENLVRSMLTGWKRGD